MSLTTEGPSEDPEDSAPRRNRARSRSLVSLHGVALPCIIALVLLLGSACGGQPPREPAAREPCERGLFIEVVERPSSVPTPLFRRVCLGRDRIYFEGVASRDPMPGDRGAAYAFDYVWCGESYAMHPATGVAVLPAWSGWDGAPSIRLHRPSSGALPRAPDEERLTVEFDGVGDELRRCLPRDRRARECRVARNLETESNPCRFAFRDGPV